MTFPTVPVFGTTALSAWVTGGGATKTFPSLSGLTKNAGDLLIAICITYDGNSTNAEFSAWGGGFTEFVDQATTATMGIGAAYKWSTGSETGTFTVTTADAGSTAAVCILLAIPGAHLTTPPEGGVITNGTTAAANIAALNPVGWDAEDTLWIAVGASGETGTSGTYDGITAPPTNYTGMIETGMTGDLVGAVEGAVAFRQLNAASEDPATFTLDLSTARNSALLIAVRPAPSGPTLSGGSTAHVNVAADGGGFKAMSGGATTIPKVSAEGGGESTSTYYAIFRRAPPTGLPFDPDSDTPIGTTTNTTYTDEDLPAGTYEYQVFGWDGSGWTSGSDLVTVVVAVALSGGSTAHVNTVESAGGRKAVSKGVTEFVQVGTDGAGRKVTGSGSTTFPKAGTDGAGQKQGKGGVTEIVQVGADGGSGPTVKRGGSTAHINVDSTGSGTEKTNGGSTARVGANGLAGGQKASRGGFTEVINVVDSGGGQKVSRGGFTETINVIDSGAGRKAARGGQTEIIGAASDGSGKTTRSGGSTAHVNVDSTGSGVEKNHGGSTARVGANADGAGRKAVSRGATTFPKVNGLAAGAKQSRSGSTDFVQVNAEGAGTPFVPAENSGGKIAHVGIDGAGVGRKAVVGGSTTHVYVNGLGSGKESSVGGSTAHVNVSAEGAGIPFVPAANAGGSTAHIGVDAEGSGIPFVPTFNAGGSTSHLTIDGQGVGRKATTGGSTAHLVVISEGGGGPGVIVVGGRPKVWDGLAWVEVPVKVWNGSAWVEKPMKVWDGSSWELV